MKSKIKIICAMLIWGSLGIFVTKINLPTAHIVAVRAAIGCLALFIISAIRGKIKTKIKTGTFLLLLFIGALVGINWLLLFEAYKYTYVSTATLLYYTQPIFLILLSTLFLREKLTKRRIIGLLLAIIGMFLINGVELGGVDPKKGLIFGIASAILYALIVFINKASKNIGEIDGLVLTEIEMLGAAVTMVVYTFLNYNGEFASIGKSDIITLVILGLVHTALAYYLYFSSIKNVDAQSLAVLSYIDPASSLIFSALILHEKLAIIQWAGAVLILGGALYSQIKGKK